MRQLLSLLSLLLVMSGARCDRAEASVSGDREKSLIQSSSAALKATLDAIEAAVEFVGNNSDTTNLDGAIGLRTVEGQSGALLARYWTQLPLWLVARLTNLRDRAAAAARLAVGSVHRRTPVYFANAGNMIAEHFWDTFYPTRPLTPQPSRPRVTAAAAAAAAAAGDFDEKFSDDCIRDFHGQEGKPRCRVTERCWRAIVLPEGLRDYALTHQLFYLMNGIQANCLTTLTSRASAQPPAGTDGSLASVFDGLCARIFAEALAVERRGFPLSDRDLFMEQIGLCGLAGYTQVAQWRWLPALLRWQRPDGCYGEFPGETVDQGNFEPGRYGNYRRRRKRAEARMPRGCLAHRTSVALDALMAYGRRIVEETFLAADAR